MNVARHRIQFFFATLYLCVYCSSEQSVSILYVHFFLLFKNSHGFRTLMLCLLKSHTFPVVSGKRHDQLYCIAKGHVISYIETWTHTTHSFVLNITFCYFFLTIPMARLEQRSKKKKRKKNKAHTTLPINLQMEWNLANTL